MPKAVVIEFALSAVESWTLVTNNSHGNTVKSTFLAFAPSGWTCDVYSANSAQTARNNVLSGLFDLAICSYVADYSIVNTLDPISSVEGIPLFMPMPNTNGIQNRDAFNRASFVFVGANPAQAGEGVRIDTWDIASNLSASSQNLTSFTTAAVAGKAASLLDAGLSAGQIYKAIRQQASNYPNWTNADGFGQAPTAYTVPESYDSFPPQSVAYFKGDGNIINATFIDMPTDVPDSYRIYTNGDLVGETSETISATDWRVPATNRKRIALEVYSDNGGAFGFTMTSVYGGIESRSHDWTLQTVSGFTSNPLPPEPPPEPQPEPEPEPTPEPKPEPPVIDIPDATIAFTSSATSLPRNGNVTLTWATTGGVIATLNGQSVSLIGSSTVRVSSDTTYTLSVTGLNNNVITSVIPVTVFDIDYKKQTAYFYPIQTDFTIVRT